MGRLTEIGFEAASSRASGLKTAKLSWPKLGGVYPAVVRRWSMFLPGEISFVLERVTSDWSSPRRREKSAEAVVANAEAEQGSPPRSAEDLGGVKG